MLTLYLTLHGRATAPTEHASVADMGEALADAFDDAGTRLTPRVVTVLLSLMARDLCTHLTWTWDAEDYQIYVIRDGPDV